MEIIYAVCRNRLGCHRHSGIHKEWIRRHFSRVVHILVRDPWIGVYDHCNDFSVIRVVNPIYFRTVLSGSRVIRVLYVFLLVTEERRITMRWTDVGLVVALGLKHYW